MAHTEGACAPTASIVILEMEADARLSKHAPPYRERAESPIRPTGIRRAGFIAGVRPSWTSRQPGRPP